MVICDGSSLISIAQMKIIQTEAAVSPAIHASKQMIPYKQRKAAATPEESKTKQMSAKWEMKRMLVKKRLMDLDKDEESTIVETPIVVHPSQESHSRPPEEIHTNNVVISSSVGVSISTMERAEEIRENLTIQFPSFIKSMLKSHVSGGFWLGLPKKFCVDHLPEEDKTIVLVGDDGGEHNTKYLVEKNGLSGGWKAFATAHKLLPVDVLVFQLIEPCKFKVYIVRASSFTETDAEPKIIEDELVKMGEDNVMITETAIDNCLELVPPPAEDDQDECTGGLDHPSDSSSEAITFSESILTFKDVKCFKDFHIHFQGLMIDAEIPLHLRTKYYELCHCQNTFLHEKLMQGLNTKLTAGMICEIINIADAIRAANQGTGVTDLQSWDRTLKAFEDLGMVVGFLRSRIDKLLTLSRQVQATKIKVKRSEMSEAKEEMRRLVAKLSDVKMQIDNLNAEIDSLVEKNEEVMYDFRKVAAAPW